MIDPKPEMFDGNELLRTFKRRTALGVLIFFYVSCPYSGMVWHSRRYKRQ